MTKWWVAVLLASGFLVLAVLVQRRVIIRTLWLIVPLGGLSLASLILAVIAFTRAPEGQPQPEQVVINAEPTPTTAASPSPSASSPAGAAVLSGGQSAAFSGGQIIELSGQSASFNPSEELGLARLELQRAMAPYLYCVFAGQQKGASFAQAKVACGQRFGESLTGLTETARLLRPLPEDATSKDKTPAPRNKK